MKTRFRDERADHVVAFFEKLLVHTKDPWARVPFELAPFQLDIIRPLFGTQMRDPESGDWVRLYNLAWLELARKNGKSELMAGIALYLLGADDEEGAEVYSVARDREQASHVFDVSRRMLELSGLGGPPRSGKPFVLYPTNKRIVYPKTNSFFRVIAADALGNLGQNPHGILFDEIIAQPNGELWDALKTGFGTRRQPMMVAATTAGDNPASFARAEHEFSMRVMDAPELAPRRFVQIAYAPIEADWSSEDTWRMANPALGIFLRPQVLRDEFITAQSNPREERSFRQFRLNQWQVHVSEGWDGADAWSRGSAGMVVGSKTTKQPTWLGLVCSSATEMSAIAVVSKNPEGPGYWCSWRWLLPKDSEVALERETNGVSAGWVDRIEFTDGDVIDVERHTALLRELVSEYDVRELAYDPNGAVGVISPLVGELGDRLVPLWSTNPQSALMDWERLLRSEPVEFVHAGDPIAAWQLGGLRVKEASTGVLKIDRRQSRTNVHGIAAAELALRRALLAVEKKSNVLHGAAF